MRSPEPRPAAASPAPPLLRATVVVAVVVAVVALVVDQVSKVVALSVAAHGPVDAPGPLSVRLVANRGVLLGFAAPMWAVLVGTVLFAVFAARSLRGATTRSAVGAGLLLGGAAGNLFDRLVHRAGFPDGAVVDWIGWGRGLTFNLADVFLIVGVVLLWEGSGPRSDAIESSSPDARHDGNLHRSAERGEPLRHARYDVT
jgi:signal peptidase II